MAIVHSRGSDLESYMLPNPGVERARDELKIRIDKAGKEASAEVEKNLRNDVKQAEQKAEAAEKLAQQQIADITNRLGPALEGLESAVGNIQQLEAQTLRACEGEIVGLAVALAARILHRELDANPEWMVPIIQDSLADLPFAQTLAVHVNPQDLAALKEHGPDQVSQTVELVADQQLRRGGLVICCGGTERDVGLESTWERLAETLRKAAPQAASAGYRLDVDGQETAPQFTQNQSDDDVDSSQTIDNTESSPAQDHTRD